MTEVCVCGHDQDEHAAGGVAGCMAVTATNQPGDVFCPCWEYDPGPPF